MSDGVRYNPSQTPVNNASSFVPGVAPTGLGSAAKAVGSVAEELDKRQKQNANMELVKAQRAFMRIAEENPGDPERVRELNEAHIQGVSDSSKFYHTSEGQMFVERMGLLSDGYVSKELDVLNMKIDDSNREEDQMFFDNLDDTFYGMLSKGEFKAAYGLMQDYLERGARTDHRGLPLHDQSVIAKGAKGLWQSGYDQMLFESLEPLTPDDIDALADRVEDKNFDTLPYFDEDGQMVDKMPIEDVYSDTHERQGLAQRMRQYARNRRENDAMGKATGIREFRKNIESELNILRDAHNVTLGGYRAKHIDSDTTVISDGSIHFENSTGESIIVRLDSIDGAEAYAPFGDKAAEAFASFFDDPNFEVVYHRIGTDRYGRAIGFVARRSKDDRAFERIDEYMADNGYYTATNRYAMGFVSNDGPDPSQFRDDMDPLSDGSYARVSEEIKADARRAIAELTQTENFAMRQKEVPEMRGIQDFIDIYGEGQMAANQHAQYEEDYADALLFGEIRQKVFYGSSPVASAYLKRMFRENPKYAQHDLQELDKLVDRAVEEKEEMFATEGYIAFKRMMPSVYNAYERSRESGADDRADALAQVMDARRKYLLGHNGARSQRLTNAAFTSLATAMEGTDPTAISNARRRVEKEPNASEAIFNSFEPGDPRREIWALPAGESLPDYAWTAFSENGYSEEAKANIFQNFTERELSADAGRLVDEMMKRYSMGAFSSEERLSLQRALTTLYISKYKDGHSGNSSDNLRIVWQETIGKNFRDYGNFLVDREVAADPENQDGLQYLKEVPDFEAMIRSDKFIDSFIDYVPPFKDSKGVPMPRSQMRIALKENMTARVETDFDGSGEAHLVFYPLGVSGSGPIQVADYVQDDRYGVPLIYGKSFSIPLSDVRAEFRPTGFDPFTPTANNYLGEGTVLRDGAYYVPKSPAYGVEPRPYPLRSVHDALQNKTKPSDHDAEHWGVINARGGR